jgi:hypothetical protein
MDFSSRCMSQRKEGAHLKESWMYIRTPHALVWVEDTLDKVNPAPQNHTGARPPHQERWATKPLNTARGRCVAVRQTSGKLELGCMVNNRLIWLAEPDQVLSERQLQNWLRDGF